MRQFKFFQKEEKVRQVLRGPEHIPAGYILPYQRSEEIIPQEEYEGWAAHYNNLPPGQCPYDIGTREREYWMNGWSNRENSVESQPEDELYVELEDTDTGECFGIPASINTEISHKGKNLFEQSRTVSGRCDYGPYEYWIDNVYSTINHTLVIEVTISVPNTVGRGVTFHKFRQIIPYETI